MSASPLESAEPPGGGKTERQRLIRKSLWFTVPGSYAVVGATYAIVPPFAGLTEPSQRIVLAAQWLLVALIPYAAVCLTILYQRYAEGAHNPLLGGESERLKVHCRVMQNTLEQLLWFALCLLALSTYLSPSQARLIPILCVFFALARFVYWRGYLREGTLGRAPGVQLTFSINIPLFVLALALFARSFFL
jgi:uncharacterized membrane protein YecN with MAPEG domain